MLKTSNVEVIRVCFAATAGSQQNVTVATNGYKQLRVSSVLHRSEDGSQPLVEIKVQDTSLTWYVTGCMHS